MLAAVLSLNCGGDEPDSAPRAEASQTLPPSVPAVSAPEPASSDQISLPPRPGVFAVRPNGSLAELHSAPEDSLNAQLIQQWVMAGELPLLSATPTLILHSSDPQVTQESLRFVWLPSYSTRAQNQFQDLNPQLEAGGPTPGLWRASFTAPLPPGILLVGSPLAWEQLAHLAVIASSEADVTTAVTQVTQMAQAESLAEVRTDLRYWAAALMSYQVDNRALPPSISPGNPQHPSSGDALMRQMPAIASGQLTTPVAYLDRRNLERSHFGYWRVDATHPLNPVVGEMMLLHPGLDGAWQFRPQMRTVAEVQSALYDATNGAQSGGDILWSPQAPFNILN
jgi:hypothetical protein